MLGSNAGRPRSKRLLGSLLGVAVIMIGSLAGWYYGFRLAAAQITGRFLQQSVIYTSGIRTAVARYDYLPAVLSRDAQLVALLQAPGDQRLIDIANAKLEFVAAESGSSAVYILDARGFAVAADNWKSPNTYIGHIYSYRPYFAGAMGGGSARYYGVGTTTGAPGLFLSKAVQDSDGRAIGVVVVKVNLETLEAEWSRAGERILVADKSEIAFLSSEQEWKFRPLHPASDATKERLLRERQYGESDFRPLLLAGGETQIGIDTYVTIASGGGRGTRGILKTVRMDDLDWTLAHFTELSAVYQQANLASVLAFSVLSAVVLGLAAASQRHQRLQAERHGRILLEQRVAERTQELRDANSRLIVEIEERRRANSALKAAQDELVHAGKMATLGQVSSAVTHEVNQPLAALQTYLASTQTFLDRGDIHTVKGNLGRMTGLVDRISAIIQDLRVFSRKTKAGRLVEVNLFDAVQAVMRLVEARLQAENVTVICDINAGATVWANQVRLEQVILNLVVNALDAMSSSSMRRLTLVMEHQADKGCRLIVHDTGRGVSEENIPHVFDPFFTTKEDGKGLGLGLSISSFIVREFGGTLSVINNQSGGAAFTITFPLRHGPATAQVQS